VRECDEAHPRQGSGHESACLSRNVDIPHLILKRAWASRPGGLTADAARQRASSATESAYRKN
jgi:hypothetical protein